MRSDLSVLEDWCKVSSDGFSLSFEEISTKSYDRTLYEVFTRTILSLRFPLWKRA